MNKWYEAGVILVYIFAYIGDERIQAWGEMSAKAL